MVLFPIVDNYDLLTKTEKAIADYIIANPTDAFSLNASELAERTQSSPATVGRFSKKIGFDSYETGKLTYGNGDPESPDYSSLSDFIYNDKEGVMEIRIPWQLLNVMDPSTHRIMGDFYTEQSITPVKLGEIYAGIGLAGETVSLNGSYTYDDWKMPEFHERLKPSYYVLLEALKELK